MQTITLTVAQYMHLLDRFPVDASFPPRVIEIVAIIEFYQENHLNILHQTRNHHPEPVRQGNPGSSQDLRSGVELLGVCV